MNAFALLRVFGKPWVAKQIDSGLKHHLSDTGKEQLAASLDAAAKALAANDLESCSEALADVVLAIH